MPETKRPLKVFLCHAHADSDAVRALYIRLIKDGVDAWFDKEKLLPGQDWELEIHKAVRESDIVVVCLSKYFNEAGFRQKEVRLALDTAMEKPEGDIFIVPARLEECENLHSLRKWHWVNLFEEDGYDKLLRALHARGDRIGAITYSLVKFDTEAEKDRLVKFLLAQAAKLEEHADWAAALENYRRIKVIRASTEGVDEKISALQRKVQASELTAKTKQEQKTVMRWLPFAAAGVLIVCCLISVMGVSWFYKKYGEVNVIPTAAVDSQTVPATLPPVLAPNTPSTEVAFTVAASEADSEMALVPAGEFSMGSNSYNPEEKPARQVYLDAFYIDKYEVTNALYKTCVDAGVCLPPEHTNSTTRSSYYGNPEFDNYPVIFVNWDMANAYCNWRGAYLPTEAQWEKAARGTNGRTYPWGEGIDKTLANYNLSIGDTNAVGSYVGGKSPYGVYDMAGNVWEWVADWYSDSYRNASLTNPLGPDAGVYRVLRGGSWLDDENIVRTSNRGWNQLEYFDHIDFGFRCASDVTP